MYYTNFTNVDTYWRYEYKDIIVDGASPNVIGGYVRAFLDTAAVYGAKATYSWALLGHANYTWPAVYRYKVRIKYVPVKYYSAWHADND